MIVLYGKFERINKFFGLHITLPIPICFNELKLVLQKGFILLK